MVNGEDNFRASKASQAQEGREKGESQEKFVQTEGIPVKKPLNFSEFLHDVRSPLTTILGAVELMKLIMEDETSTREELEEYIQQIEQETLRLRDMLS